MRQSIHHFTTSIRRVSLWAALCLSGGQALFAQENYSLWYDAPALKWTEALPVGNGRLGAMVFGDFGKERIQLNEESVWAGSKMNNNNPAARQHLPEIRKALFQGAYQRAWELSDAHLLGTPPRVRSYQPLGDLFIQYRWGSAPVAYKRALDLNNGISRTTYTVAGKNFTQEVFVSAPLDIVVVSLQSDQEFDADITLTREYDVTRYDHKEGIAWYEGQIDDEESPLEGPGGKHMRFCTAMKVLKIDGTAAPVVTSGTAGFSITRTRKAVFILTGTTDYRLETLDTDANIDPLKICQAILKKAARQKEEQIRAGHEKEHRSVFERVQFRLGKEVSTLPTDVRLQHVKDGKTDLSLIPLYYQYGRYLLMASSRRPGRLPANLQGVWNDLYAAKWNSDFHTNINLQMNYWPAETGNLPETLLPLAEFVKKLTTPGSITAREMYGARGWTIHHLTDVYGRTGVADGVWGLSPMAGPWLTFPLYRHYEFTQDKAYLKKTAYPVIKGAVEFVLDFLVESPEGYLVTNPSHSPENPFYVPDSDKKEKTYLSYAATIDTQIILALFGNFMEAAGILKTDADLVKKVKEVQTRLPPMRVGSNGTLQEWIHDYEEVEPGHRHISHLLGLYPLSLITPSDTVLFQAARKTIERRMAYSTRHVGWSSAWIINFYARLLDGEKAGNQVQRLLEYSTLGNLLNTIPPFQIDGNFGGAAGIAEMLLQSHQHTLHILPALPSSWQEGTVSGLRARGNYTVDIAWEEGRLSRLTIHSPGNQTARIGYRNRFTEVRLKKGKNEFASPESLWGSAK